MPQVISVVEEIIESACENLHFLVLHNDEVNSMEHVILSLVKVLKISDDEAVKFTLTAHFEGSAYVKEGTFEELEVFHGQFGDLNITTSIE